MPTCQALNCSFAGGNGKSRFSFPNPERSLEEKQLCEIWIERLKNPKLNKKTFKWNRSKFVCEDHFASECFVGVFDNEVAKSLNFIPKKKRLLQGSIPTIISFGNEPGTASSNSTEKDEEHDRTLQHKKNGINSRPKYLKVKPHTKVSSTHFLRSASLRSHSRVRCLKETAIPSLFTRGSTVQQGKEPLSLRPSNINKRLDGKHLRFPTEKKKNLPIFMCKNKHNKRKSSQRQNILHDHTYIRKEHDAIKNFNAKKKKKRASPAEVPYKKAQTHDSTSFQVDTSDAASEQIATNSNSDIISSVFTVGFTVVRDSINISGNTQIGRDDNTIVQMETDEIGTVKIEADNHTDCHSTGTIIKTEPLDDLSFVQIRSDDPADILVEKDSSAVKQMDTDSLTTWVGVETDEPQDDNSSFTGLKRLGIQDAVKLETDSHAISGLRVDGIASELVVSDSSSQMKTDDCTVVQKGMKNCTTQQIQTHYSSTDQIEIHLHSTMGSPEDCSVHFKVPIREDKTTENTDSDDKYFEVEGSVSASDVSQTAEMDVLGKQEELCISSMTNEHDSDTDYCSLELSCDTEETLTACSKIDDVDDNFSIVPSKESVTVPTNDSSYYWALVSRVEQKLSRLFVLYATCESFSIVQFYRSRSCVSVKLSIEISKEYQCEIFVHRLKVSKKHPIWKELPSRFNEAASILKLCDRFLKYKVCCGNFDEKFRFLDETLTSDSDSVLAFREGDFHAVSGGFVPYASTIRTTTCSLLSTNNRCADCKEFRAVLHSRKKRLKKTETFHSNHQHGYISKQNLTQNIYEQEQVCFYPEILKEN